MFLSERSNEREYSDQPDLPAAEVLDSHRQLSRINRSFHFTDPYMRLLPAMLGPERCRSLDILDLGAGDGLLARTLEDRARARKWDWRVTCLDLNPHALQVDGSPRAVNASVLSLPFQTASFNLVIASQMTHHLASADQVQRHFQEAWRVTSGAIFLSDLHRNAGLYGFMWLWLHLFGFSRSFIRDGLISIRRGWRVPEWRQLAAAAGIPQARVWVYYGARIMLWAQKS